MNPPSALSMPSEFGGDLRAYLLLCEEALVLATRENQALNQPADYQPFEFYQKRKGLLPRLEQALIRLRGWRQAWQQASPAGRAFGPEVKVLFERVQGLLMRVLLLDRENQQALLRRGLLPASHLPPAAGQQPHFVASLYRRHSSS